MRVTTNIRIDEHGDETHESWLLIRASKVSSTPGAWLFDSDIAHQHYISVSITRCTRRRNLNRDWLFGKSTLLEMAMSQAQWGAFVSSFGDGGGVPATLQFLHGQGMIPRTPAESRFAESHQEVMDAGRKALAGVQESYGRVMDAFENGGKRAMREALRDLGNNLDQAPGSMEFAAESLTEHVENVVTKARADIEGMVMAAAERGELAEVSSPLLLVPGSSTESRDEAPAEDGREA